jgi:hypothetical protein
MFGVVIDFCKNPSIFKTQLVSNIVGVFNESQGPNLI